MDKNYELVLVLAPDLKDDQVASMKDQITTEMTNLGAEIVNQDDWGKRELAFEVKDFMQGYYHLYQFTAPVDMPGKFKGLLKVNEKVIRYLLTTWEPKAKPDEEEKPEEPVEVAEEVKKADEPKVKAIEEAKPEVPVEAVEEVKKADEPTAKPDEEAKPEEPVEAVEEVKKAEEPTAEVETEKPTEDTDNTK